MAIRFSLRKTRSRTNNHAMAAALRRPLSGSTRLLSENTATLPDALLEISRLSRLARLGAAWNEGNDEERSETRR